MDRKRIGFCRGRARKILQEFNIVQLPIDIKSILESKGYIYIEVDFIENIDAMFLKKNSRLYIGVNKKHSNTRKRFSLAHELGHKELFHNLSYYTSTPSIDRPPENPYMEHKKNHKILEAEANEFAGELLVPLEMLKKQYSKSKDLNLLAKIFDVSPAVLSIRVSSQGLLFK